MQTPEIRIELSERAKELMGRLRDGPGLLKEVARAMDFQNQLVIEQISTWRMMGNNGKPLPPELHILGVRSARYRKSLRASRARVAGNQVESGIGSNVKYAGIHEFGGTIHVPPRKGKARLRLNAGKDEALARQIGFPNLAVFASRRHKRVREVEYQTKGHDVHIPARAPVTWGIKDREGAYGAAVSAAMAKFLEGEG